MTSRFELNKAVRINTVYSFVEMLGYGRGVNAGDNLSVMFQCNHLSTGNYGFLFSESGLGLTLAPVGSKTVTKPFLVSVQMNDHFRLVVDAQPLISLAMDSHHPSYGRSNALLFQANLRPANWLPLRSRMPEIGEIVYAIGYTSTFAISRGRVVEIHASDEGKATMVLTDCDLHHGFCGGPLIDLNGSCLGLGASSTRFETHGGRRVSRGMSGIYESIPSLLNLFGINVIE